MCSSLTFQQEIKSQKDSMHFLIYMQQRGDFNPVTPAQRSVMFLQKLSERRHILYKITPTNATLTTSEEYIFPQTPAFHEKPL